MPQAEVREQFDADPHEGSANPIPFLNIASPDVHPRHRGGHRGRNSAHGQDESPLEDGQITNREI